jgi:hypothetical protein
MTNGEYLVGIDFNPGKSSQVDKIKRMAADLIDAVDAIAGKNALPDVARLQSIAITQIEDGAMWAVKAATKRPR